MNRLRGIRVVSFDVGGTLIDPWPSVGHVYAQVAVELGRAAVDPDWLNARFAAAWRNKINFQYSQAEWAVVVAQTFGGAETDFAPSTPFFKRLYERFTLAEAWTVHADVPPTLDVLRARGMRLAIISNWDERLRPLLRNLELDPYFERIFVSAEVGVQKPSPAIFQGAAASLRVDPEDILHVGDSRREDWEGAREAGFQAVLVRRPPQSRHPGEIGKLTDLIDEGGPGRGDHGG